METLSSDSRQPPDGHEFPDYTENEQNEEKLVREIYLNQQLGMNEKRVQASQKSPDSVNWSYNRSSCGDISTVPFEKSLLKTNSVSNSDLSSSYLKNNIDNVELRKRNGLEPTLYSRSQSLIDMSSISKQKNDHRWSVLAEQRKKNYSKLKGLIIPEHVSEIETSVVNIPEIISHTAPAFVLESKSESTKCYPSNIKTSPSWTKTVLEKPESNTEDAISTKLPVKPIVPSDTQSATNKLKSVDELRLDNLSDSPKSLESITSPTRSDCSFDYITNSTIKIKPHKTSKESFSYVSKLHKDIGKFEDESDNDSAVSSSQSSYISRCSPPPSPTRACELLDYDSNDRNKIDSIQDDEYNSFQCRLLKAASVEAVNRKNILASAKCRSGRDLKVGSPIIQRKYDEDESSSSNSLELEISPVKLQTPVKIPPIAEPRLSLKEAKRSVSCDEQSIGKHVINSKINGFTETISSKPLVKNGKATNPIANFAVQLRETKLPSKINNIKPSSLRNNAKAMSVTDLRKSFEQNSTGPPPIPQNITIISKKETKPVVSRIGEKSHTRGNVTEKKPEQIESIKTERVKPTIVPIPKEDKKETKDEICDNQRKIVLCPEFVGGSIGITLAGGTDYETKEITVHKIRYGSVAYNDGRLKRGDKIVSINSKSTANLTHAESVELLKEAVSHFVLMVQDGKEDIPGAKRKSSSFELPVLEKLPDVRKSTNLDESVGQSVEKKPTHVVHLIKNCAGLGFSIEGGRDSPQGDLPLRVKKIFQGGLAEKNGELCVGDELVAINDINLSTLSRIETWSLMKKLPEGNATIHIYR